MGISHCCELVPFEFEIDSLSKVCVKSSAIFALFSSGRLEVGKEMHSSGRLEVGKEMHLERKNEENRERKLNVLLLRRKDLIGHKDTGTQRHRDTKTQERHNDTGGTQ